MFTTDQFVDAEIAYRRQLGRRAPQPGSTGRTARTGRYPVGLRGRWHGRTAA